MPPSQWTGEKQQQNGRRLKPSAYRVWKIRGKTRRTYTPIPAPNTGENRVHGRVNDRESVPCRRWAGKCFFAGLRDFSCLQIVDKRRKKRNDVDVRGMLFTRGKKREKKVATVHTLAPYRAGRVVADLGAHVAAWPVYDGARRLLQLSFSVGTQRGAHRLAGSLIDCTMHLVLADQRIPVFVYSHQVPCGSPAQLVVSCGDASVPATASILAVDIAAPGEHARRLSRTGARAVS